MFLSVVIPVMNEEGNIARLSESIGKALVGIEHEVIFVDDGSRDRTVHEIEEYGNPGTSVLVLNRNYGQTTAMAAGIDAATGELIVMLDGDLQNDPADIPLMIERLQQGQWDVVAGIRANRQDGFLLRKIPSKIANWMIRASTGVYIKDYGCTLKLFRADVAKNLGLYGELHRYIPVLASMYGAKMTQMDVRHHPRHAGVSKYGIGRTFKVASDLMLMLFFSEVWSETDAFVRWGGLAFVHDRNVDQWLSRNLQNTGAAYWRQAVTYSWPVVDNRGYSIDFHRFYRRSDHAYVLRIAGQKAV